MSAGAPAVTLEVAPSAPESALLVARAVGRRFGRRTALADVDVTLVPGRVVGLFGPNGAGKSTLLSLLAGHLRPSSGEVCWFGEGARGRFRGWMGMLPQAAPLPRHETPRRILVHLARVQRAVAPDAAAAEVLDAIGLAARADLRMRVLSEGERKLVAIGQAFLGAPQVVLLDEPTSALDPWGRQRLRALVRARRDAGAAVLLASHNLAEAEQLCDEAIVLVAGRVQTVGALSTLLHAPDEIRFEIGVSGAIPVAQLRAALAGVIVEFDAETRVLSLQGIGSAAPVERVVGTAFGLLAAAGAEVRRVVCGRSLERALTALVTLDEGRAAEQAEVVRS